MLWIVASNASSSNGFSMIRSCVTPSAARRRGGTPVISASGAPWKICRELRRQLRRAGRAGDHEIAEHGRGRVPRAAARRAPRDVAHQRGRKARLAQHLGHQPADVHVVFDDENDFSSH